MSTKYECGQKINYGHKTLNCEYKIQIYDKIKIWGKLIVCYKNTNLCIIWTCAYKMFICPYNLPNCTCNIVMCAYKRLIIATQILICTFVFLKC